MWLPSLDLGKMRAELLKVARTGTTITYGQLMRSHRLSRGRALSKAIGEVDKLEYAWGAPGFAAIIVRKDSGYPGGGYFCDDDLPVPLRRSRARGSDPRLSAAERDYVTRAQKKIWAYYVTPGRARVRSMPS